MALFTQPARRESLKVRIALDGPTGSGKTWTALQIARIIAGPNKVAVIDTENRSAAYYAPATDGPIDRTNWFDPPYEFFHLPVAPPYDPRELAMTIKNAAQELGPDDVLIIDSLSHFWNGEGGTLDQVDHAAARAHGNTFAGWKEGTPMQRYMVDSIVHAPFHVIGTMRSKMEYVVEEVTDKNGRKMSRPRKIGMAPVQREGLEYEFTIVGDMDLEHRLVVSKSRCDDVADEVYTSGRSSEFGIAVAAWLKAGVDPISPEQIEAITNRFNSISDERTRADVKIDFLRAFGRPDQLYSTTVERALAWIDERIPEPSQAPAPAPAEQEAPAADDTFDVDDLFDGEDQPEPVDLDALNSQATETKRAAQKLKAR